MPIEIFFCYAHEDEALKQRLEKQLKVLKRQGIIHMWHDRLISAGQEWEREIDRHLNTSQIILLLISPHFLDSDYCYGREMKRAMERHERGEARVIPIILSPVYWQGTPLGKLQALPTNAKPVIAWRNRDIAFFDVAEGIRKTVEELAGKPSISVVEEKSPLNRPGFSPPSPRRLPVYLMLDCSGSMMGYVISAVSEGLDLMYRGLVSNPQTIEAVWLSIITFSTKAEQQPLTPIDQFVPPRLAAGGLAALGSAIHLLVVSIERDLVPTTATRHGDYPPLVFIFTDGVPTDEYHSSLTRLQALTGNYKPRIVAIGLGSDADLKVLHEITPNVYSVPLARTKSISSFFKWIADLLVEMTEPTTTIAERAELFTDLLDPPEDVANMSSN